MDLFRNPKLFDSCSRVARIAESIEQAKPLGVEESRQLLREIALIKEDISSVKNPAAKGLFEDLHGKVNQFLRDGEPLHPASQDELLRMCEEIRLHLIAAGIWLIATGKFEIELAQADVIEGEGTESLSPVTHGYGGTTSATVLGHRVILLPRLSTEEDLFDLLADFSAIFDVTPPSHNWVLDFSFVEEFPLYLIATLLSYQSQLKERGAELFVGWLRPDAVPKPLRNRLEEKFSLKQVGGHYFSFSKE